MNVSGTEFNKHGLEIVVEDLPLLENLDISCTRVDDITPLRKCKDRLKTLTMYNIKISGCGSLIPVLLELNELRNLDISDEKDTYAFEMFAPKKQKIGDFLKAVHCMPHLTSLDLSGKYLNIFLYYTYVYIYTHFFFLTIFIYVYIFFR